MQNRFESIFRDFVQDFNGKLLPESDFETADYFFPKDNVIAELKTLEADARLEHATKVQGLVADWMRRRLIIVMGRAVIHLRRLNPICQREWISVLQAPVERIIRKANSQIRSTKEQLGIDNVKGLLLIANDGNLLHTDPIDYMTLIARVLQKRNEKGDCPYPHIRAVVYFSHRVGSRDEGHPFWIAGYVQKTDPEMQEFQTRLRQAWLRYLATKTGRSITVQFRDVN